MGLFKRRKNAVATGGRVTLVLGTQSDKPCKLVAEPWGSEFPFEAGHNLTIEVTPDSSGRVEVFHYDDSIVVWSSVDEPIIRDDSGSILPL